MSSGQQLALSLFEDLAAVGGTIEHAPKDLGYHRNNILIQITDLNLTARRAIDVAYFLVAEEPELKKGYEVDLNFFRWLMAYPSNNRTHLRAVLREGQKAALQVEMPDSADETTPDRWGSVQLLGFVAINNGKLYFEVHENLQKHIKNPKTSHFLSLKYVFKSLHAKIIYDRLQLFVDESITPWYDLDHLRQLLGCTAKTYEEFKYLKRYVLEVAIKQINEITDLEVDYDTKNVPGSKKIGQLRFRIKKRAGIDSGKAAMLLLKNLYVSLTEEFGCSTADINKILANRTEWTDDRILQAMDYTRFQLAQKKIKKRVAGYLIMALEKGLIVGEADRIVAMQQQSRLGAPLPKPFNNTQEQLPAALSAHIDHVRSADLKQRSEKALMGYKVYKDLPADDQHTLLTAFCAGPVASIICRRMKITAEQLPEKIDTDEWVRDEFGAFVVGSLRTKTAQRKKSSDKESPSPE